MTWVAIRQYRLEIYAGLAILIAMAAFLVPTGISMLGWLEDSGLKACLATGIQDCSGPEQSFQDSLPGWLFVPLVWLEIMPAIIGLLLAAPIVLDLEQRTYRLAWTQSITKRRWIAVKLGVALLGAVIFAVAATALLTWWLSPQDSVYHPFRSFENEGVAPLAYIVFALALALAVGVLTRRIIVAMVVTLIGYMVARLFVDEVLRPGYMAPVERIVPVSVDPQLELTERAWVLGSNLIDGAGNTLTEAQAQELCGDISNGTAQSAFDCLDRLGIAEKVLFHPPDRFWTFQAIEAAIFLGAAAVLLGLTVWVVSRRMK